MIDPLRYRSLKIQLEFDEHDEPVQCWQCLLQRNESIPAFFFCHDCDGKVNNARPFCRPCFFDYHARKRGKEHHKPHPIVRGNPVIVQTLAEGDGKTFAKMHDWVTLDYTLTTDHSDDIIEDTFTTKQPLVFQSGCSGPCVHLQLLGCTNIAAADVLGSSDPYCAVYWKNELVGVTSTKHMTLDPSWANQTFVLPLTDNFMSELNTDNPPTLVNVTAGLPQLKIEVYDWDRLSKNDFLGQASICDAEILRILQQARTSEAAENQVLSFPLLAKQSRGKLGIRVAIRGKRLLVHVVKGENLPNADPHSLSDPFCEVYWNEKKVGTTAHIDDTLDPVWNLEIFAIKIDAEGPNSVEQATLRIECLDWDQFGSNDVLGQVEFKGWQIKELAENNMTNDAGGGGVEGGLDESDVLSEADVEAIYEFVQKFQQQQEKDRGAGGMVVGVPREMWRQKMEGRTSVNRPQIDSVDMAQEGATEKKDEIMGGDEPNDIEMGNERGDKRVARGAMKPKRSKANSKRATGKKAQAVEGEYSASPSEPRTVGSDKPSEENVVQHKRTPSVAVEGELVSKGEHVNLGEKVSESAKVVAGTEIAKSWIPAKDLHVAGNPAEKFSASSQENGGVDAGNRVAVLTETPEVPRPAIASCSTTNEPNTGAIIDNSGSAEGGVGGAGEAMVRATDRLSREFEEGVNTGVRKGKSSSKPIPPSPIRYREATVQEFKEDKGILVMYMDNKSLEWIAAGVIPYLQIRSKEPTRNVFLQRMWDQCSALLHLHKHVLNIKRSLRIVLHLSMTGSYMRWYDLRLTPAQSGADLVRGTVNARFLFHTRGSVGRGLDVAVSHMSLGERARVEIRSDYAFGEVYGDRLLPPYANLIFFMQVTAIRDHSAKWFLLQRDLRDMVEDTLSRIRLGIFDMAASCTAWRQARLKALEPKGSGTTPRQ